MSPDAAHPVSTRARTSAARRSIASLVVAGAILAACGGDTLTGPSSGGKETPDEKTRALLALACSASVESRTIQCSPEDPLLSASVVGLPGFGSRNDWMPVGPAAAPPAEILIGNQNVNIKVITKDVAVAVDSFVFNAGITNLSPAPIGTLDGEGSDNSLRIFFSSGPAVTDIAGGTAFVANADGSATFTGPNQPYFDYGAILFQNDTSAYKQWRIAFTPQVRSFVFTLLVSASVEHPNGYVTIHPPLDSIDDGATTQLVDSIRNALGWPLTGQSVTWTSSNDAVATVSSSGLVTGESPGTATIFAKTAGKDSAEATIVVRASASSVIAAPDTTASTSAPGDAFHGAFNTLFTLGAPGLLANDALGTPAATVTHFGGGTLGASVLDNTAGSSAPFGTGGSVTVSANGAVSMTPPTGFTGYVSFYYRITNSSGTSDALVRLAVGARPSASNSTYPFTLVGNVRINTDTAGGSGTTVTASGDGLSFNVTGGTGGAGTINNANKRYAFTPDAGFSGSASFTFTAQNGFGVTAPATVTLPVGKVVWFVDNLHANTHGDGRRNSPLFCLPSPGCTPGATVDSGDVYHIATGSGTYNHFNTPPLLANNRVIGQGATGAFSSAANANLSWPADSGTEPATGGARPTVNSNEANVFLLATGNTIRGVIAGSSTGPSVRGSAVGTFTMGDAAIVNPTSRALQLTTSGTLAITLDSIVGLGGEVVPGGGSHGIFLHKQAGVLTSGVTRIRNPVGTGIFVDSSAGFSFGNTFVKKTNTGRGIFLRDNSGTTTFSSLVDSTAAGTALETSSAGTVSLGAGLIQAVGGFAIDALSTAFSGAGLTSTSASGGNGGVHLFLVSGTLNLGGGSLEAIGNAMQVAHSSASITYSGSITNSGAAVSIHGTGTNICPTSFTHSGKIVATQGGISIRLCTNGGPIVFSGPDTLSTGVNNAIDLISNFNTPISFTGGALSVTTTTGRALNAENFGILSVTGTQNSLSSTGGIALYLSGVNIAAAGLTFRSISANGGATGILLNNTGTAGGLTVTGVATGTDNCGGSPNTGGASETAGVSAECTGGTIQAMSGADGSTTAGVGVSLANTAKVSLSRMRFTGIHQNYGIRGVSVTDFALANSLFDGTFGTTAGTVGANAGEAVIYFDNLLGTSSITGNTVTGGVGRNINVDNDVDAATAKLVSLTVSDNIIRNSHAATGDDGFRLEAGLNADVDNVTINANRFAAHGGDHIDFSLLNNADVTATVSNNRLRGGHAVGSGQGIYALGASHAGNFNYTVSGNNMQGNRLGGAVFISKGSGTGTFKGTISNNVIGEVATTNSGSLEGSGIVIGTRGASGTHTTLISNNSVFQYEDRGMVFEVGEMGVGPVTGALKLNATVTGNTVSNFADAINSFHGVHFLLGLNATDVPEVCLDVGGTGLGNSLTSAGNEPQGASDLRVALGGGAASIARLRGYAGAATDVTAVNNYFSGRNTLTTVSSTRPGGGSFLNTAGSAACAQP